MSQTQQNKENQDSWDRLLEERNAANNYNGEKGPSILEKIGYPIGFALLFKMILYNLPHCK